jgi:hypothetical protein
VAREGSTCLLDLALAQGSKVQDEEASALEQCGNVALGLVVVTGQEDDPLASRRASPSWHAPSVVDVGYGSVGDRRSPGVI